MIQRNTEKPVSSCVLIGSTNLLIECYEIAKGRNWDIAAVITNDIPVSNYFVSHDVTVVPNIESIILSSAKRRFDYLFSIVNERILTREILSIPEKGAINYHDSCLPEGAGVYATTWAIMNKQKTHGITWHWMDEGIDTGDILEQKVLDIAETDTSFVLNVKCFAAAIESFKILLDNIEKNRLHPKKQDLNKRTYYPFTKRPQNSGFIDFRTEESVWEPILRALYFGKNDNYFCTPKVYLKGHIYVVNAYNWSNDTVPLEPGQIKIIDNAILRVQCTKRILNIRKLTTLLGEVVPVMDLIKHHGLKDGDRFDYPDLTFLDSLFHYTKTAISAEKYWTNRFSHLDLVDFPMQNVLHYESDTINKPSYSFPINDEIFLLCTNSNNNGFLSNCTALLFLYISRLLNRYNYDIWFQSNSLGSVFASYYSEIVPMHVSLNKKGTCRDMLNECSDAIHSVYKKPSFSLDIFQRIRYLKETDQKELFRRIPFLIEWQNDSSCERDDDRVDWKLVLSEKKKTIDLICSKNGVNQVLGENFFLHFAVFIRNLLHSAQPTLDTIKILSDEELHNKVFEYNKGKVPYPKSKGVHELINEWILKTPAEVALVCEGRQLTYGNLGEKANRISRCLHSKKVTPEDLIGVMMKRSENVIISYLAIWNMGCAYVPLDPELPAARIQYMVDNARVKLIIKDDDIADEFNVESLNFNHALSSLAADQPLLLPENKPGLAYVKYTSGSTGLPKGVMISHENIVVFLYSYREVVGVKNKRTGTCVAPLSFDTSVDEIYSCICFGGTAHIMMKQQVLDLNYFSNYLTESKINVSYIIPEFLEGVGKSLQNQSEIYLQTILTGLHAKKNRAFENFFGLHSEIRVLNAYGPTEVTYGSSAYRVRGTEPRDEYTPIGKPFPNYQTYVVDSEMQILPDFVAGELLIAGPALSSGYINNPETTREKFVDFSIGDSITRVYKTGDRVCYLSSGDVAFMGRNDDQVKISGYRIELGEIEEALLKMSNISQSLVLTKNIGTLGYRIVAYIVLKNRSEADMQRVEYELKSRLPLYMVPSFFVPLDKIPQFPNGKINFHALPEPKRNQEKPENKIIPVNETEKKLKRIFEHHLGVGEIGVHDHFFDIGGDSLAAVHIMQEIENQFQRHIPISLLYQFPTVKRIAHEIMYKTFEGRRDSLIGIHENGDLSPLFFVHSLGGSVLMYHEIIQQLDKQHPVFGIQSSYDHTLDLSGNTIKTIAKGYVEEIVKIAQSRTVYIAGFSFGGVMAFEIACWLQKMGHPHKLIILDTRMNNFRRKLHPRKYYMEEHLLFLFWLIKYLIRMVLDIVVGRNPIKARNKFNHLKFEISVFQQIRKNKKGVNEPGGMDVEIAKVSHKLSENYEPGIYKGDMCLIQCVGGNNGKVYNKTMTNYYRSFVKGKIRKFHVNAYHIDMLKQEKGKRVAEIMNTIIREGTDPKPR